MLVKLRHMLDKYGTGTVCGPAWRQVRGAAAPLVTLQLCWYGVATLNTLTGLNCLFTNAAE